MKKKFNWLIFLLVTLGLILLSFIIVIPSGGKVIDCVYICSGAILCNIVYHVTQYLKGKN